MKVFLTGFMLLALISLAVGPEGPPNSVIYQSNASSCLDTKSKKLHAGVQGEQIRFEEKIQLKCDS
jgi:hypothetical protein